MQFPESWLRTLVNPPLTTDELCHLLTMAGLEVEECRPAGADFSNVVVARILSADKHPDADKLQLCRVDTGEHGVLQIVCGAPNAAAGLVVPCALVGAQLPSMTIKRAKVRGIESVGMLCSARELGMSDDHGGLLVLPDDAPIGQDIRRYLNLDDNLITLKLTPNRADCLALTGIAREVAALTGAPLHLPVAPAVPAVVADRRAVELDAPAVCPRYCGRVVRGVAAAAPTPAWLRQRLERCGIRPISILVDITNYVMLELGQPLHAFDNRRLQGAIHVRYPHEGEQLLLLNTQTVSPGADTALIADEVKALAIAGIMGGEHSGITDDTADLFLESAFFQPDAIAGKARQMGFSSDASYRYERGVDFELQRHAIERATQLILDHCGGQAGPVVEAVRPDALPQRPPVCLRMERARRVLGLDIDNAQIEKLIAGLGFAYRCEDERLFVTPPAYRFDIAIEEDLIEELARLHGYDNIPVRPPQARQQMLPLPEGRRDPMQVRRQLVDRGFFEVVNYSFVDADWEADLAANPQPVRLANPIASQLAVMRSSLIGGLLETLAVNLKRQAEQVRIFEVGRCFVADSRALTGFCQPLRLAALHAGPPAPQQWDGEHRRADFYDLKGDLEALFAPQRLHFEAAPHPAFHPGRCARISLQGNPIGFLGELHPRWQQKYALPLLPVLFEIELEALLAPPLPVYRDVSRLPALVRDIALVLAQSIPAQAVLDAWSAAAVGHVRKVALFDVYQGKGVAENHKSLAFRIILQDNERTLSDADADLAVGKLLDIAQQQFAAVLRG